MNNKENNKVNSLQLISEAAFKLKPYGICKLCYITAQFAPYSRTFCPDLIFQLMERPDVNFFIEYWPGLIDNFGINAVDIITEHRNFVQSQFEGIVEYSYATDELISNANSMLETGLTILDNIKSGIQLGDAVLKWSGNSLPRN